MRKLALDDRKDKILKLVVDSYVKSGEPVGSTTLKNTGKLDISPATIRNEMNSLEEMGFLEKTHTSSGRVPSVMGYRYYVDELMRRTKLLRQEADLIDSLLAQFDGNVEGLFKSFGEVLSKLTGYTAVTLTPYSNGYISKFSVIPSGRHSIVIISVTTTGKVLKSVYKTNEVINLIDLEKFEKILNEKLGGISCEEINSDTFNSVLAEVMKNCSIYDRAIESIKDMLLNEMNYQSIYVDGEEKMFDHPEFQSVDKAKHILSLFNNLQFLSDIFTQNDDDFKIYISDENLSENTKDLSIVSCQYDIKGMGKGSFGLVGPTRMDYSKAVAVLEYLKDKITFMLDDDDDDDRR